MLPRWRRRVLAFRLLGLVPSAPVVVDVIRQAAGRMRAYDFSRSLESSRDIIEILRAEQVSIEGMHALELGTGWHPVVPIVLYGLGSERLVLSDVTAHVRRAQVAESVDYCLSHAQLFAEIAGRSSSQEMEQRWRALLPVDKSWRQRWNDLGIEYVAPYDLSKANKYPANSFDVIYSHSCIGFIPREDFGSVVSEMHRLLRPDGISCHVVDLTDDHANLDASIGPLDFLKYDEATWQRIGNCRLHYQNRFRPRDYVQFFESPAWRVKYDLNPDPSVKVNRTGFAEQFQGLSDEELQSERFTLIARSGAV